MKIFTPQKAVQFVVEFFDMFSYPVTLMEVIAYSPVPLSLTQAQQELTSQYFESQNGYYFLKGKSALVLKRLTSQRLFEEKFKKVKRTLSWISACPVIEQVYICNSMSFGSVTDKSDVDLFIVIKEGKLWSARLWSMIVTILFGTRITKENYKGKVCLSFFATTSADITKAYQGDDDYYMYMWHKALIPLITSTTNKQIALRPHSRARRLFAWFGFFEPVWRRTQLALMSAQKKKLAQVGDTHVIMNAEMIKLHVLDYRSEYTEEINKRLSRYA